MSEMTVPGTIPTVEEQKKQAQDSDNLKFAMWLYLASETIIFSVFIAAYAVFRVQQPDIVHEIHESLGISGILLVTFNSFLLLTSSWAMVMGLRQIQRNDVQGLIRWLSLTALLGTIFVILQYVEYNSLGAKGVTLDFSRDEFTGFGMHFYAPTAFHGAHVIIGVIWCLDVIRRARLGRYSGYKYAGVEVFGLYWHFVDVVWVVLFTLIYLV
jgi:cytochrome c oxidase subunit III